MWAVFKNWLIGNMGVPGDYAYQAMHWYTIAAVALAFFVLVALGILLRKNEKASRRLV